MIRNNNNQQNGRRRGRGGGQGGGGGGGMPPRPQGGQNYGNNRLDIRQRGNATQLLEKYKTLARDAAQQGDRVVSEYYLQYADHYFRVLNEIRERQPENQRGPRPGYDADEDDGADVGNGYNPAYAAQSTGSAQDDGEGERSDDYGDEAPRAAAPPQRDAQRDTQREDRPRRDEPRYAREQQPRRDDQRQGDGRGEPRRDDSRRDGQRSDTRRPEMRDEPRRDDSQRNDGRNDAQRNDSPRNDSPRNDAQRSDSQRDDSQRDGPRARRDEPRADRPVQDAAPRDTRRTGARAPATLPDDDDDGPLLAGLPGPATLSVAAPEAAIEAVTEEPPRRRRGRPRKVDVEAAALAAANADA